MRSYVIGLSGVLLLAATGCAAEDVDDGTNDSVASEGAPPEKTTTGAPVSGAQDPSAGSEGTGPRGSAGTDAPAHGSPSPGADKAPEPGSDPGPVAGGPGPKPAGTCSITKDAAGFFTRNSGKGSYVAYVPAKYDPNTPMRLIVGLHGCGDNAQNFATWGVNPSATRATQDHIGISLGSETGSNGCWSSADDPKVLAAVDDLSKCFWIHQSKVTIAGFSSGGNVAYRVGMQNASRFAGILIENSTISSGGNPTTLLAGASRKIPIAHRAHSGDTVYPIGTVKADWAKISAASFPLASSEVAGTHDGTSQDWSGWLIPQSAAFVAP